MYVSFSSGCIPSQQNGFWFSLGMCGLFFVPVIVLSVIASTCYMRQKSPISPTYFTDDPYADYLMEDS